MRFLKNNKILRIIFEVLIVSFFIYYYINNKSKFEILSNIPWAALILIAILNVITILLNSLFFKEIVKVYEVFMKHKESLFISILSALGNFIGPLQGGVGIRAYYLKKKFNLSYSNFSYTFLANYLIAYLVICIQALIGIYLIGREGLGISKGVIFFFVLLFFGIIIALFLPHIYYFNERKNRFMRSTFDHYNKLISGWHKITKNKAVLLRLLILVILTTLTHTTIFWIEFSAINIEISLSQVMLYSSIVSISTLFAFTPGGIGIRETILILLQSSLGISTSEILSVSLIDRGVYFFILIILYLLFKAKGFNILKGISKKEDNLKKVVDKLDEKNDKPDKSKSNSNKIFPFIHQNKLLLILIFSFLIISYLFVFAISDGSIPDEEYHIRLSSIHEKENDWIPTVDNTKESYRLGEISRIGYLYHFINSKLLKLNIFDISDYTWLRLFNPIYGLISLILIYKITLVAFKEKNVALFSTLLFMTSIMFLFLSSGISYDNLVILLTLASIYYLVRFIEAKEIILFITSLIFIFLASLAKYSATVGIVPIGFAGIFYYVKYYNKGLFNELWSSLISKRKNIILMLIFALTLFLFCNLYVVNYFKYKQVIPDCDKVLTVENCMENSIYARDKNYKEALTEDSIKLNIIQYFGNWYEFNISRLYGILGYEIGYFNKVSGYTFFTLLAISLLFMISNTRLYKNKYVILFLLFFFFYSFILFNKNYSGYKSSGAEGLAVQGRYLLPFFGLLTSVISISLYENINRSKIFFRNILLISAISLITFGIISFWVFYAPTNDKVNFPICFECKDNQ